MERPLADRRPIGPISEMGSGPHQDLLFIVSGFSGSSTVIPAVADGITDESGLNIDEEDVRLDVNQSGQFVFTVHTGGPDVTHSDLMAAEGVVREETNSEVVESIVRAK